MADAWVGVVCTCTTVIVWVRGCIYAGEWHYEDVGSCKVHVARCDFLLALNLIQTCIIYSYILYMSVCIQLSEIGVELQFILDDLLSSDLNKLIQQAGDNQMDAVRHRAAVSRHTHMSHCPHIVLSIHCM